jgi:hypothetical protein
MVFPGSWRLFSWARLTAPRHHCSYNESLVIGPCREPVKSNWNSHSPLTQRLFASTSFHDVLSKIRAHHIYLCVLHASPTFAQIISFMSPTYVVSCTPLLTNPSHVQIFSLAICLRTSFKATQVFPTKHRGLSPQQRPIRTLDTPKAVKEANLFSHFTNKCLTYPKGWDTNTFPHVSTPTADCDL